MVHYARPGSSIKQPTPKSVATVCYVNWPVVKIMDPVSNGPPLLYNISFTEPFQNLRRIFVATLVQELLIKLTERLLDYHTTSKTGWGAAEMEGWSKLCQAVKIILLPYLQVFIAICFF